MKLVVAVLGGDRRQEWVGRRFADLGAQVRVTGLNLEKPDSLTVAVSGAAEALAGAGLIMAPVQGIDALGDICTMPGAGRVHIGPRELRELAPDAVCFAGAVAPPTRALLAEHGVDLVEYREMDDFAILNSIPSAEGAIQLAMERLPITLHGSRSLVLGYGRTARTLARMLRGLGAHVAVAARRPADLARVEADAHEAISFAGLDARLNRMEVVFNTVPAVVLDAGRLGLLTPGTVVIDLASAPGGVDHAAAAGLGVTAVLAPGLPGKVAPRSAGQYIADLAVRYLKASGSPWAEYLADRGGGRQ